MKYFFLIFFLFWNTQIILSQKLVIIVIDEISSSPIVNVNANLSERYFSVSNSFGEITFTQIPLGEYSLNATHLGYNDFIEQIFIQSDTAFSIQLTPAKIKLKEVIVTSTRYEKNIKDIPYAVTILDEKKLQRSSSVTISDMLGEQPGISLLRDGIWGTEISIRGLSRANVLTLIDGSRVETSTDLSARLSMIDLYNIERIEVIKGGVSSLYGTGATGGIINIIFKSGNYESDFNTKADYSAGLNSVNNLFTNGLNLFLSDENWILNFSGSYRKAGNTKTPSGKLSNSQFEDNSLSSTLRFRPLQNHEIKLNVQRFKAWNVGIPGAAPLFPSSAIVTYPQEERLLYSADYKINNLTKELIKLNAKYFYQFISRDVQNLPGIVQIVPGNNGQPSRRVSVLSIDPGAEHRVHGFQNQADLVFNNHYLIAGVDFWKRNYNGTRVRNQKIDLLSSTDSSVISTTLKSTYEKPLPNANFYSTGLYIQDDIKVNEYFKVMLGGRYDFIWLDNEKTLNPLYEINNGVINNSPPDQKTIWEAKSAENKSYNFNLGLVYTLNDYSDLSFSAANSFRSPSLEERYQYIDLGSLIRVGDPNLQPENGYFFNAAYKFYEDKINLNADIFYNTLSNLVSEIPGIYENRDALIKVNIDKARIYGFEFSAEYTLTKLVQLYNTFSYVRGINPKDDSNLPQIAPANGIAGVRFNPYKWLSTELSAVGFAAQSKITAGEKETPGYVYFNLGFVFSDLEIGIAKIQLILGIENMFDREYRNHLSTNRGLIVSEPERNFYLRANFTF